MNTMQEISEAKKFLQSRKDFLQIYHSGTCWLNMPQDVLINLLAEYKKTKTKPKTFVVRNINCDEESLECAMTEMFVPLDVIFLIEKPENEKIFFTIENTEKNILIANELKNRLLDTGQNIEIELD